MPKLRTNLLKTQRTGVTTSWQDFDDGYFQAGSAIVPRFLDNGDNTVIDRSTGLQWVNDVAAIEGAQAFKGTWSIATSYSIGDVVDDDIAATTHWLCVLPQLDNPIAGYFDNTEYFVGDYVYNEFAVYRCKIDHTSSGADVDADGSSTNWEFVTTTMNFADIRRCFPGTWKQIYFVNGNGGVNQMSWQQGLLACAFLDFAGHSDWRMPNINEMMSIVDFSQRNPCVDTSIFTDLQVGNHFTSTINASYMTQAWSVDMVDAQTAAVNILYSNYVKPVRGGSMGKILANGTFKIRVTIPSACTYYLPMDQGGTYLFTVDYGDGSDAVPVVAWDDANASKFFEPGTYDITISGTCTKLNFNSDIYLTKVLEVTGDLGLTSLSFVNCTNLDEVSTFGNQSSLYDVSQCFSGCSSLATLPADLFSGCPNITICYGLCQYSGLIAIPADLFSAFGKNIDNLAYCFQACPLYGIPSGLFAGMTKLTYLDSCFGGCHSLGMIPDGLFDDVKATVQSYQGIFTECYALSSLPAGLFANATAGNNFRQMFYGCTGLASLPSDLFSGVVQGAFMATFYGCTNLSSIPTGLFDSVTWANEFAGTFFGCENLYTVPEQFFRPHIHCLNFSSVFGNCTKLAANAYIFYAQGEESTRFHNQNVNLSQCFYRSIFTGAPGVAPDLWNCDFGSGTPNRNTCFGGSGNSVSSFSNYASIPSAWK